MLFLPDPSVKRLSRKRGKPMSLVTSTIGRSLQACSHLLRNVQARDVFSSGTVPLRVPAKLLDDVKSFIRKATRKLPLDVVGKPIKAL